MNFDSKSIAGTITRTLLVVFGTLLVSRKIITADDLAALSEVLGVLITTAVGAWGVIQKIRANKTKAEQISLAVLAPASATVAQIEEKHAELKAADQPIAIV